MPHTTTPRNAICPCRSGRKFKHCCLNKRGVGRFVSTSRTSRTDLLARLSSAPPAFTATRRTGQPTVQDWQRVHVTFTTTTGQTVSAVLLHTASWLTAHGVAVGGPAEMRLPGLEVGGVGTITRIEPSPVGADTEGQVLTVAKRLESIATPFHDPRPVEEVKALLDTGDGRIGQVIFTRPSGWDEDHRAVLERVAAGAICPERADGWRLIRVAADSADGAGVHAVLCETAEWVAAVSVTVGERVAVNLPGREVRWEFRGSGRVVGVEPPPFVPGRGGPWGFVGSARPGQQRSAGALKAPIESIRVGEYVLTFEDEEQLPSRPREPAIRFRVELRHDRDGGGWVDVVLLRTEEWLTANGVAVGGAVELDLEEMSVCGPASVLAVEPVLVSLHGEGRMVTGTFHHTDGDIGDLRVWGEPEPIGVTCGHLFWSVDRGDWVRVGELQPGETVEVWGGLQMVESYTPNVRVGPVYNIEVEGDHCYRVGEQGILVHNESANQGAGAEPAAKEECSCQIKLSQYRRRGLTPDAIVREEGISQADHYLWRIACQIAHMAGVRPQSGSTPVVAVALVCDVESNRFRIVVSYNLLRGVELVRAATEAVLGAGHWIGSAPPFHSEQNIVTRYGIDNIAGIAASRCICLGCVLLLTAVANHLASPRGSDAVPTCHQNGMAAISEARAWCEAGMSPIPFLNQF